MDGAGGDGPSETAFPCSVRVCGPEALSPVNLPAGCMECHPARRMCSSWQCVVHGKTVVFGICRRRRPQGNQPRKEPPVFLWYANRRLHVILPPQHKGQILFSARNCSCQSVRGYRQFAVVTHPPSQVIATKDIAPGAQVLWDYGPRGNDDFFLYYGFVLPGNSFDAFELFESVSSAYQWYCAVWKGGFVAPMCVFVCVRARARIRLCVCVYQPDGVVCTCFAAIARTVLYLARAAEGSAAQNVTFSCRAEVCACMQCWVAVAVKSSCSASPS